jgi:hypothetical protein
VTFYTVESDMPMVDLPGGSLLVFQAIDPTTGAGVSGVDVAEIAVYADDLGGGRIDTEDVVPSWTPLEVEEA